MEEEIERLRNRLQRPTEKYQDEVRVLSILDRKFNCLVYDDFMLAIQTA